MPSPNTLEKDAGFCSGGDDDDSEESNRSNSDDSGLKMGRLVVAKSKRKCAEPLKLTTKSDYPIKKRIRYDHRQPEPEPEAEASRSSGDSWDHNHPAEQRVPPPHAPPSTQITHPNTNQRSFFSVDALLAKPSPPQPAPPLPPPPPPPREQRNYKNMTRERRIEANARERTRVHTISAAFDTLRKSIPAYSHNQKLSKLSVLRIACSYIMALSKVAAGDDEEEVEDSEQSGGGLSLAECVESVSRTIQTEGKLRKRRDDV